MNGTIATKIGNRGRVSKITSRDTRALAFIIKRDRRASIRNLASEWCQAVGKSIGREWTRQYLKKLGYGFYKAKKKPLLTPLQKKKRLEWAKIRSSWTQRQWNSVIFSDESKFEVCVGDTRKHVIRKKGKEFHKDCLKRTVKFPTSVMVWGCFSAKGVGKLHFIEGTLNAQKYCQILEQYLLTSIPMTTFDEFVFQQDGAPCHTAKITRKWFQDNGIDVLDWPSSSPDLNPIENLWALMKRRLRNEPQTTLRGLKDKLTDIWASITREECQHLINTMNKRVNAVIKNKGDVTQF